MTTVAATICDKCGKDIDVNELRMHDGVYSDLDIHLECLDLISAKELIVMLALDDIKVMKYEDWQGAMKANSYFRRNPSSLASTS